jgi:hypothetical protein
MIIKGFDEARLDNLLCAFISNAVLAEAHSQVDIVINSMIARTGLQIKTIEALACGSALVVPQVAVEGPPESGGKVS